MELGWYKRTSPDFNWISLNQCFSFICTKYSTCKITTAIILLGDWFSPEHKIWTFGKVHRVKWKVFFPYLTTATCSHLLPPANLELDISGDLGLICRTPINVPTKLVVHCSGRDPSLALCPGSVLFLRGSASQFLEISWCPLSCLNLDLRPLSSGSWCLGSRQ